KQYGGWWVGGSGGGEGLQQSPRTSQTRPPWGHLWRGVGRAGRRTQSSKHRHLHRGRGARSPLVTACRPRPRPSPGRPRLVGIGGRATHGGRGCCGSTDSAPQTGSPTRRLRLLQRSCRVYSKVTGRAPPGPEPPASSSPARRASGPPARLGRAARAGSRCPRARAQEGGAGPGAGRGGGARAEPGARGGGARSPERGGRGRGGAGRGRGCAARAARRHQAPRPPARPPPRAPQPRRPRPEPRRCSAVALTARARAADLRPRPDSSAPRRGPGAMGRLPRRVAALLLGLLVECTEAKKHCWYFEGLYPTYYICRPYEDCCGSRCCVRALSIQRLWYFWFLLMMGVLFCCGAGFFIRRRMYPPPLIEEPAFNVSYTRQPPNPAPGGQQPGLPYYTDPGGPGMNPAGNPMAMAFQVQPNSPQGSTAYPPPPSYCNTPPPPYEQVVKAK
uniref:WW domain binding protein VOPP1 n=4 Tax=Canis lupus TaxID=9612 RepID=A0A8P0TM29_CANLF